MMFDHHHPLTGPRVSSLYTMEVRESDVLPITVVPERGVNGADPQQRAM
jgi:hypothetical protein